MLCCVVFLFLIKFFQIHVGASTKLKLEPRHEERSTSGFSNAQGAEDLRWIAQSSKVTPGMLLFLIKCKIIFMDRHVTICKQNQY